MRLMQDADHRESASASIATIHAHSDYLIQLLRYLRETGDHSMAQQIVDDFNAAMARLFAAHDAKTAEAAGASDLKQQLAFLQGQLDSEQAKNAELEKAMSDAIATANARAPATV